MFKEYHPFIPPDDENAKIWRYMDLAKFMSLLENKTLYFCRYDKFDDRHEGAWPKKNIISLLSKAKDKTHESFMKSMLQDVMEWRKCNAINCWHISEYESAAMWDLYIPKGIGIAIQSRYRLLRDAIVDPRTIYIGKVSYIDYESDIIPEESGGTNIYKPLLHKRIDFAHERELRAVINIMPTGKNFPSSSFFSEETISHGVDVAVNVRALCESVYIPPRMGFWYKQLIEKIIHTYGYSDIIHINESKLDSIPDMSLLR